MARKTERSIERDLEVLLPLLELCGHVGFVGVVWWRDRCKCAMPKCRTTAFNVSAGGPDGRFNGLAMYVANAEPQEGEEWKGR